MNARRLVVLALFISALFGSRSGIAADNTARQRLDFFLKDLSTLSSDFEQRVFDESGALLETSFGNLQVTKPGKFVWVYMKPYHQTITSDGKTLWLYDEELAQVTVNAVEKNAAGSAAQLLGGNVDIDSQYTVKELGVREGKRWVRLSPKNREQQYSAVEVGLSDNTLAVMRLSDSLGQITELRFLALRRNPVLDGSRFVVVPPPGVDVVTGTTGAGK